MEREPDLELIIYLGSKEPGPKLTTFQRNDLYKSVEEGGLSPAEFDLTEIYEPEKIETVPVISSLRAKVIGSREEQIPGRRLAQIKHLSSNSIFKIGITSGGYLSDGTHSRERPYSDASTAPQKPDCSYAAMIAGRRRYSGSGWDGCLNDLRRWAADVKRECVDPDLWTLLRRGRQFLTDAQRADSANTPFTSAEQAEIAEWLREIKEYVQETYSLSAEQAVRVETRFNEAEDASRRMGRKDWLLLFGGALFSLILSAVVPPDVVQHILIIAAQNLGHLFGREAPPGLPP